MHSYEIYTSGWIVLFAFELLAFRQVFRISKFYRIWHIRTYGEFNAIHFKFKTNPKEQINYTPKHIKTKRIKISARYKEHWLIQFVSFEQKRIRANRLREKSVGKFVRFFLSRFFANLRFIHTTTRRAFIVNEIDCTSIFCRFFFLLVLCSRSFFIVTTFMCGIEHARRANKI